MPDPILAIDYIRLEFVIYEAFQIKQFSQIPVYEYDDMLSRALNVCGTKYGGRPVCRAV